MVERLTRIERGRHRHGKRDGEAEHLLVAAEDLDTPDCAGPTAVVNDAKRIAAAAAAKIASTNVRLAGSFCQAGRFADRDQPILGFLAFWHSPAFNPPLNR